MTGNNTGNDVLQTAVNSIVATMGNQDGAARGAGAVDMPETVAAYRVPVAKLDQRCCEHRQHERTWTHLELLTGPASTVKENAATFLVRKPKELQDIYDSRCDSFTYTNLIGNGLGWYVANLFKHDVDVSVKLNGVTTNPDDDAALEYYGRFLKDCDRAGTTFYEAMQRVFRMLCTFRSAYVLLDLPTRVLAADNAAEQVIEPYLAIFPPSAVINCSRDTYGNLQWIVFKTEFTHTPFLGAPEKVTRWSYYDKVSFRIYEYRAGDQRREGETEPMATLVDEGLHALADYKRSEYDVPGRVPVLFAEVDEILWLGARVYLQQLDHINLENTLKWALFLGNLPMPVIKTESEYMPERNEAGAVVLKPGDSYEWAEPSGNTFTISQARLDRLREEIYRAMYLQAQGRSESATPAAQSGISKEQDMAPSRDVLNAFGAVMRKLIFAVLDTIASIRLEQETVSFDVRGLQHNDDPITTDLTDVQTVRSLGIQSDKFDKEAQKFAIRKFGRTWPDEIVTACCKEVDSAPSKSELDAQAKADEQQQMQSRMAQSFRLVADDAADKADDTEA